MRSERDEARKREGIEAHDAETPDRKRIEYLGVIELAAKNANMSETEAMEFAIQDVARSRAERRANRK